MLKYFMDYSKIKPLVRLLKKTSNLSMVMLINKAPESLPFKVKEQANHFLAEPTFNQQEGGGNLLQNLEIFFTLNELKTGREKISPRAYSAWLLGRLAVKLAIADLLGPSSDEEIKSPSHHFLGKEALKQKENSLAWPFQSLEINNNANGAPEIKFLNKMRPDKIFISISHTLGAALGVAALKPVGVDLECMDRIFSDHSWQWAFSEKERALAGTLDEQAIYPRRLGFWCAKEAAGKCWGLALLNHFSKINICGVDWAEKEIIVEKNGPKPKQATVKLSKFENYLVALAL